ncbi:MAG: hypothetical protein OEZ06_13685 [Myxococcales bacterium]|nr:hypothetical protein [Myxococcales bacterium]
MSGLASKLPWLALLVFAGVEVTSHAVTRARVASDSDFEAAARSLRAELKPRDLITSAPDWTDPRLRLVLGDAIDLAMAGRSDDAAYERMWSLSIRGARPAGAPATAPELSRRFGGVTLERWSLGPSTVQTDLVAELWSAKVEQLQAGGPQDCRQAQHPAARGGGLGRAVVPPQRRFQCPKQREQAWVGPVVLEDLELSPRHCVHHRPLPGAPLRVQYPAQELGERLALYGGLYYEDERMGQGADVELRVALDGQPLATLKHRDGDGWKRMMVETGGRRGALSFEVHSRQQQRRTFCWAASIRRGEERGP